MQKPTVIIVDDSHMMTQFLSIFLMEKYKTVIFNCPIQALNAIQKGLRPDIVITDLNLPNMDGHTFIKEMKRTLPMTPIMVISSETNSLIRMKSLILGADSFISKPFNPKELEIRIQKLIRPLNMIAEEEEEDKVSVLSISREIMKRAAIL